MTLVKVVNELEVMPRGYGIAWHRPWERRAICLPVGLHIVAGAARSAWLAFRAWSVPSRDYAAWVAGYAEARDASAVCRTEDARIAERQRRDAFWAGYNYCGRDILADLEHREHPPVPTWAKR